jgi:hypothetical protein
MESAEFNQQLLYKLIREQRSTGQTDTDIIFIDDMILNTDEKILNGWNAHFERLSTPDINHHNNNGLIGIRMRTHRTNNHRSKETNETTRHNYGRGRKGNLPTSKW